MISSPALIALSSYLLPACRGGCCALPMSQRESTEIETYKSSTV